MDYKKLFDKLVEKIGVEKLGKEEIGMLIVGEYCPRLIDLPNIEDCGTNLQNCTDCWAKALGMDEEEY